MPCFRFSSAPLAPGAGPSGTQPSHSDPLQERVRTPTAVNDQSLTARTRADAVLRRCNTAMLSGRQLPAPKRNGPITSSTYCGAFAKYPSAWITSIGRPGTTKRSSHVCSGQESDDDDDAGDATPSVAAGPRASLRREAQRVKMNSAERSAP